MVERVRVCERERESNEDKRKNEKKIVWRVFCVCHIIFFPLCSFGNLTSSLVHTIINIIITNSMAIEIVCHTPQNHTTSA